MALSVGTTAPVFTTTDEAGNSISLSDYQGKTVVLYFYPKDDTPGCTKEACSFRDAHTTYAAKNVVVLGVSMDDATSHQAFKDKYGLPFTLVVDTDGAITRAYDVAGERNGVFYSQRVTFVIDDSGVITQVFDTVKTETHAADILAELGL